MDMKKAETLYWLNLNKPATFPMLTISSIPYGFCFPCSYDWKVKDLYIIGQGKIRA
jgi:hypothetical protein